jgi:hypothetical protein
MVAYDVESVAWSDLGERIPFLRGKAARSARATGYVCLDGSCRQPTNDATELARQLRERALLTSASQEGQRDPP